MFPFEPWVAGLHFAELGRWQVTLPRDTRPSGPGDDENEDDGNIEPPDDDFADEDEDDEDEDEDDEDTLWARLRNWYAATHNDVL